MPAQLTLKPGNAKKPCSEQAESDDQQTTGEIDLPPIGVEDHAQRVCTETEQDEHRRKAKHERQAQSDGAPIPALSSRAGH